MRAPGGESDREHKGLGFSIILRFKRGECGIEKSFEEQSACTYANLYDWQ